MRASRCMPTLSTRTCAEWLGALGVVGEALPVDDHHGLVTDHPGVVSRRGDHHVAGPELVLGAIVHADAHASRDDVARVRALAALGLGDRLDVLRPAPARLEDRTAHDALAADVDDLQLAAVVLEGAHLVRCVEALAQQSTRVRRHRVSPMVLPAAPARMSWHSL